MGYGQLRPSRVFRFGLVRVAGGSFDHLESLVLSGVAAELSQLESASRRLGTVRDQLVDRLHAIVGEHKESEVRRILLAAKRDAFNSRQLRCADRLAGHLDLDSAGLAGEYARILTEVSTARSAALAAYDREIPAARTRLLELGSSPTLQKGLTLGSHALLGAFEQALRPDVILSEKKQRQLERGLVKYLSRIHAKTSPFSTFTAVIPVKIVFGRPASDSVWLDQQLPQLHNKVSLNTYFCHHSVELLGDDQKASRRLPLRPNPTIRLTDSHLEFMINYRNIESFQRVGATPVVTELLAAVASGNNAVCVAEIAQEMVSQGQIEASPEEVEAFLFRLVDCGLLEFAIDVSEHDEDWHVRACALIESLATEAPYFEYLKAALQGAPALMERFGFADSKGRLEVLAELRQRFTAAFECCQKLGQTRPMVVRDISESQVGAEISGAFYRYRYGGEVLSDRHMLYENVSASSPLRFPRHEAERLANALSDLLKEMRPYDINVEERINMRDFFVHQYPQPERPVLLLTFYEDYYRNRVMPELKRARQGRALHRGPEIVARRDRGLARWKKVLAELATQRSYQEEGEMHLSAECLRMRASDHQEDDLAQADETSYAGFFQPYRNQPDGPIMAVLHDVAPGFGKMFGRFLTVLPQQIKTGLREANSGMLDGAMLVENSDASFFSANVHPPLLPYCVSMPGSRDGFSAEARIPISDIAVELPDSESVLQLVHLPTGRRVFVIDLGLQVHAGRSKLFRLLDQFTVAQYSSCAPLLRTIRVLSDPPEEPVWRRPRIVYERTLVLQRMAWGAVREAVPSREPGETDGQYFVRLNEWRTAQGIPTECFVMVMNRDQITPEEHVELARGRRDDWKPQFLSFHNPFLVSLFERLLARAETTLTFEEMLPAPHQLSRFGGERFVTELLLQTYPVRRGDVQDRGETKGSDSEAAV